MTSGNDIIHVTFNEVGEHEVALSQIFNSSAYVDEVQVGNEIDTSYTVTVLEPVDMTVSARFVLPDGTIGEELDLTSTNQMPAGRSIRFYFSAVGEPANLYYTATGASPESIHYNEGQIVDGTADETDIQYKRLGLYDVALQAGRQRPAGADTLVFENLIEVIPSTDPVNLTGVYAKDGKVAIDFSREIDPLSINVDNFSVRLMNKGSEWTPSIGNATIDPTSGNIVLLELDGEKLYNDDQVWVSYTPGTLRSADFKNIDAIEDNPMVFLPSSNTLATSGTVDYGFENSTEANWPYLWWGAPWDGYTLSMSSEAYSGTKSAKLEVTTGAIIGHRNDVGEDQTVPMTSGVTYEIGVYIKVESGLSTIDDSAGEVPNLIVFTKPGTNWAASRFNFNSYTQVGEWIYAKLDFYTPQADGDYTFMIRANNQGNPSPLVFYIDNFVVSEVQLRP